MLLEPVKLYWIIVFLTLSLADSFVAVAQEDTVSVSENLQFNPLDESVLGFNSPMGMAYLTGGDYASEKLLEGAVKLPANALRYPGGTVANFFDWGAQKLNAEVIKQVGKPSILKLLKVDRKRNRGDLTHVDLNSFFHASEMLGFRPFIVANLFTEQPSTILKTIEDIKAQYKQPVYWELGNELSVVSYAGKYKPPGGWDAEVYLKKAKRIATHIRDKYPDDKIGINVSEPVYGRAPTVRLFGGSDNSGEEWDSIVNSIKDYDAVIIHPYVFLTKKHYALFEKENSKEPIVSKDPVVEGRWRWLFSSAQGLPDIYVKRLSDRFPGKKIWLTELGISGGRAAELESGSMERLLFNVAFFSNWMSHYPRMEAFLYHALLFGKNPNAVLYRDYSYTANGLSLAFIGAAIKGGAEIAVPVFESSPTYSGIGPYNRLQVSALSGLYVRSPAGDRLLVANSGNKSVKLQSPFKGVRVIDYGGDIEQKRLESEIFNLKDLPVREVQGNEIEIKPFSVTLVYDAVSESVKQ